MIEQSIKNFKLLFYALQTFQSYLHSRIFNLILILSNIDKKSIINLISLSSLLFYLLFSFLLCFALLSGGFQYGSNRTYNNGSDERELAIFLYYENGEKINSEACKIQFSCISFFSCLFCGLFFCTFLYSHFIFTN